MTDTATPITTTETDAWQGFVGTQWKITIDVRDFIQANYEPYTGDSSFLSGATERTTGIWSTLSELMVIENQKGILDVDVHTPATITSHEPGYIDKDNEIIVGLQTDAPLKRAIMPNGGYRMVESGLKAYGYEPDPQVREIFTKYRKTHNDGVFDAYTPDIMAARRSGIVTGLPDAYGRGRIIGDYRRVALYGVDRLLERKKQEKDALAFLHSTDDVIRDREELSEQIRALGELVEMAASYGFDVTRPAQDAQEAVQWTYLAYLAAVKEQNGAAMSLGRVSTFLDVYIERDLAAGRITEEFAQEIVDDFVIKLRIVRFLRTPEYDELFSGDPTWVTEAIGGMGEDGRPLVTKTSFRFLQTLYNLGPAPEPNLTVFWSPGPAAGLQGLLGQGLHRHLVHPVRERRAHAAPVRRRHRDRLLRVRDAGGQADAVLRCAREPGQGAAVRPQRRTRRDHRQQIADVGDPVTGDVLDFDEVVEKLDETMEWLAQTYVNALNVIHYMHDKYSYERIEMALHDYAPARTLACGIAGLSVLAD